MSAATEIHFYYFCDMKERVVIGLSGGVDSSVAAWVLKEEGYEVIGLFMKNWHDKEGVLTGDCSGDDDVMFAEMVAKKLEIPFHYVDLSGPYRKRVVDYMFSEYSKGRTPNPDILCNREIKFDIFADEAFKLGAKFVATGHYCRKGIIESPDGKIYSLLAGVDRNKDQSYFLCQLSQEQLATALFPIGEMTKPKVRQIAAGLKLPTADRKDSQGICFVGKVHLPTFLQQKLDAKRGRTILIDSSYKFPQQIEGIPDKDIDENTLMSICAPFYYTPDAGKTIGTHNGAHFFTIGQRKGINIGGFKEPLFIISTDITANLLYAGEGHDHPGLNRKGLSINSDEIHWIRPDLVLKPGESVDYDIRIRYRQPLQSGRLYMRENGLYIVFNELQRGIAPGQFAAWYRGDELVGSGVING